MPDARWRICSWETPDEEFPFSVMASNRGGTNGELTKKETESLRISARCSSCKLRKVCNTCVAAAIAETGKADGVPEYLCRYTEATVRYLKETSKK